jgi:light-regulated signal transduction histidine kinase (bacteriophytochrome)
VLDVNRLASGPPLGLDPTICEREPIHIPGAIQPHGALLAILADSSVITHASENLFDILGRTPQAVLGKQVEQVLGKAADAVLQSATAAEETVVPHQTDPNEPSLSFHAFRTGRHIAVDIQATHPHPDMKSPMIAVQTVLGTFERATTRAELYQAAIVGLHAISGYDRVMIYQFGDRGHGEVVAEVHAAQLEPYLGNHYPTTDIPPQARRQFLRQRVGSVADSSYIPVQVFTDAKFDDGEPLDLTESHLRSVSPLHCEFMRNMGTGASLSIGLISESKLLGLILCHNTVPRIAGPELRAAADMIGRVASLLLVSLEKAEIVRERTARSATLRSIASMLAVPVPLANALGAAEPELLRLLNATGAVIRLDGNLLCLGKTPPSTATTQLLSIMESGGAGMMSAMDDVPRAHPELADCARDGSGALLMPLSQDGKDLILWFRPELKRIVTWAGNPTKDIRDPTTGQVSPRASFAAWQQTTTGSSKPWSTADLAISADLQRIVEEEVARRARVEIALLRQYEALNERLEIEAIQRSNALSEETSERISAQAALRQVQKMEAIGQLTGGVAHDFNNVLAAVLGNLELAGSAITDPSILLLIGRAQRAAERGAKLTDHLLSFARKQPLRRETCDVNQLITDFSSLISRTIGSSISKVLDLAEDLWPVIADSVQFEMALLNLAVNARDAMPSGGTLTVVTMNSPAASADQPGDLPFGDYTSIAVRDTGTGMSEDLLQKAFEPFFTTKQTGQGRGLG